MAAHVDNNIVDRARRLWNQAPDEIKESGGCFLAAAADLALVINAHETEIKPITRLCSNLQNGLCYKTCEASTIVDSINHNVVNQNRSVIMSSLTDKSVECPQSVIKELKGTVRGTANTFLTIGAISSFIFILIETIHLWNFWESIKDARNMTELSKTRRGRISKTLSDILRDITMLNQCIEQIRSGKTSSAILNVRAVRQIDRIRQKLDRVQRDLRDLEVEVDNKKTRLCDLRKHSKISMATNLVTGTTTSVNAGLLASVANPWLFGLSVTFAVINFGLAAANVATYIISADDLKKIEEELEMIASIERQRRDLEDMLNSKAEEVWQAMEEVAEATIIT